MTYNRSLCRLIYLRIVNVVFDNKNLDVSEVFYETNVGRLQRRYSIPIHQVSSYIVVL